MTSTPPRGKAPPRAADTPWHALSVDDVLASLGSTRAGLSEDEARERLARVGYNALRAAPPTSAWKILVDQLRSVVVLLLAVAGGIALFAGDIPEAVAVGAVLVLNTAIGFVMEMRARRAMAALLGLETPHALVRRDQRVREIDARELVPGDLIVMEAGAALPADARLVDATELRTVEAALTGESLPADKRTDPLPAATPLPDRADMLYLGTTVAAGRATAVVVETGMRTELGRIGGMVGAIPEERTPLEHRLDALGRRLVWLALAAGAVVTALGALHGEPLAAMLEAGIALAIAAVPEGLPAVATIALAVGVRRMARRRALVRRLPSVETLGSVTVVCTDKTGTLTAGEMTVVTLWVAGRSIDVSGAGYEPTGIFTHDSTPVEPTEDPWLETALRIAMLSNRSDLVRTDESWTVRGDPTEGALLVAARKAGLQREQALIVWPEVGEVPFSSERMLMATFHCPPAGSLTASVKGAPQRVLALCTRFATAEGERPLDSASRQRLVARNESLAARGLRVLALATGRVDRMGEDALRELTFVGYAGLMDPPAAGVRDTIRTLDGAGIRTVMLTGDQRRTAESVARALGILAAGESVVDASDLADAPGDADAAYSATGELSAPLAARIRRAGAFSRVSPEDKLSIVTAFQESGDIVAMLGDGVNDAAALKKADVGVAMGVRGTDVAKEASAVVLLDDRFATVGAAVEEGRVIFDNIRKFVFYLFSCNLAEILVLLVAGLVGLPLPLLPLQILWLNLVTDTFPALALALEPAEPNVMRRPPRDPEQAILSRTFLRTVLVYGLLITVPTMVAYLLGRMGASANGARAVTMSFMTLALAQAFHLGNARSLGHVLTPERATSNRWAVGAVVLVVVLQLFTIYLPPLARALGTYPLHILDWAIVLPLSLGPAIAGQLFKLLSGGRAARARAV